MKGYLNSYIKFARNLLDNSDFTKPVNQRGSTSYAASGYTIDRWLKEQSAVVSIVNGGITINNTASSVDECFIQKIDSDMAQSLIGKSVTIAICLSDGRVYANHGVVAYDQEINIISEDGWSCQTYFYANYQSYQSVRLCVYKGYSVSIRWIALYEDAYSVESLPQYIPKGYSEELRECQRYYIKMASGWSMNGYNGAGKNCVYAHFDTPVTMRAKPTFGWSGTNNAVVRSYDTDYSVNLNNFSVNYLTAGYVEILVSGSFNHMEIVSVFSDYATVYLSADL